MNWNWQQPDWPDFRYDAGRLEVSEAAFLKQGGMLLGAFKYLGSEDEKELLAEAAVSEAMTTSAVEGEILDRESVRSSVRRLFGMPTDRRRVGPKEDGISQMTADVFRDEAKKLSHETLWRWHAMLMTGRVGITIGGYRSDPEPMLIVSTSAGRETVHFEAPPAERVPEEMDRFMEWFNSTRTGVPSLTRAGIAHLYFETIHPFEDGNGRIGRAISEKALAQGLGQPSLALLSTEIEARQKQYYEELGHASRANEITRWLEWFADAVLSAQRRTQRWVDFVIAKTRTLDRLRGQLNARQEKALLRMFREGPEGFKGGLSSGNYQKITGALPATARRDLFELVRLEALSRTGRGKGTRYWLNLP